MPLISFEANKLLYEVFVGIKDICGDWFEKIGTYKVAENTSLNKPNRFLCTSLGSPCTPSCSLFNPLKQCEHSKLEIRQLSAADSVHLLFAQKKEDRVFWTNFYECFHPKKDPKDALPKRTTLEFPDDLPDVPEAVIQQTAKASLSLKKDDPKYWSQERLVWALGEDKVKKRIAMSDWYWSWLNKILMPAHVEPNLKLLKAKHDLDEALSKKYGKKELSDEDMYEISPSDGIYVEVKKAISVLGDGLCGVKVKLLTTPANQETYNDSGNEQKSSVEKSPKIIRHPVSPPHKLNLSDSNHRPPGG